MPVLSPFEPELMEASVILTTTLVERLVHHQGVEKVSAVHSPLSYRVLFSGDDCWPNMASPSAE